MYNQRSAIVLALALITTLGCSRSVPEPVEQRAELRPNILLISLDTLRPDHLGCFGYTKNTSPNLDAFAKKSVVFTNCRSQATWTLPSHMSLFTSMLPSSNGVDNLNKVLPEEIPTLAEILRSDGYKTAALVNNGQMKAHWGFSRGFTTWKEFEVDTDAGNCENIAREALSWLKTAEPANPFFLFLHFYDVHDPYSAPIAYRQRMSARLAGDDCRKLCFRHRSPDQKIEDPKLPFDLQASYDAEINWLDHELGKLLVEIPANTMVVIFSDHGEAFKEHGWLLHGASVFEEEIRVPLLFRLPDGNPKGKVLHDSVMLMDVTPTILASCGSAQPETYQGLDLSPLFQGKKIEERLIPSESKAVLEGRYSLAVTLYPLKGIYSLFDGRFDLYTLPEEMKPLEEMDRLASEAVFKPLRDWMNTEQYWMLHAKGKGDFEATIELSEGRFGLYIPVGLDPLRDHFEVLDEGRTLSWHVYPGGGVKSLFLQPDKSDASLRIDCKINGNRSKELLFLGKSGKHPDQMPALIPSDLSPVSPVIDKPFRTNQEGFHLFKHRTEGAARRNSRVQPLEEQTIHQLRSLGYLQ